ncbi:OmpA family protein [Ulvibacterium marinum]|uniref:OmpA family protein n=1 Tax=Ulvibacterium marinum TaxID=2419782 RepID=A0A3B0BYL2_9FLAO|nr:OmpA family protein [Ulvibacterium marinum]RKN76927.1 OmpA family protein [Ulvibacterium marinum]
MKSYTLHLFAVVLFVSNSIFSQEEELQLTSKDSVVVSSWVVGLGLNIVDDSATPFGEDFLDIKDTWHTVPYPSRISIGRFFRSGIGLEAIGTYNRYKEGKIVDGAINSSLREYFAIDGKISYDINKIIGETGWFDPYLHVGAGYSSIGSVGRSTANAGFGFNTWFSDRWGLNFNTMGKWGIPEGSTKQIQHSAAVVYRFGIKKELSKKGLEKLALIEAMEKEKQRVNDSIAAADRAREEAAMAKQLAEEKARAIAEKERIEAEKRRKQLIEDRIKELGHVYFNFDSHALNSDSKKVLEGLADILKENPDLKIKIASGTDSRGPAPYNLGLSQRRVNSTKDYLLSLGIDQIRLSIEAYGENNLLNECDDNTYCPEAKHKINRRSEFIVIRL